MAKAPLTGLDGALAACELAPGDHIGGFLPTELCGRSLPSAQPTAVSSSLASWDPDVAAAAVHDDGVTHRPGQ